VLGQQSRSLAIIIKFCADLGPPGLTRTELGVTAELFSHVTES
jgi:hypothetical protein